MKTIKFQEMEIAPSKIVCIGRNYVEHIYELGNEIPETIVVFNKPNSALSKQLHFFSDDARFEGEICFLIKNKQITGVGFGLDLTKANLQNALKEKGLPWERAKGFDRSAIFGEFVPFNGDLTKLHFELYINDELKQFASYDLMIYKPDVMLKEIESFMSLEDGDIIMSGTPKGVSNYKIDDVFKGVIYYKDEILVESFLESKGKQLKVKDIPFADLVGIEQDGSELSLSVKDEVLNHLKTIHAGAQFSLAETQSGIYLQALFPELAGKVVPILRDGQIKYKKPAQEKIFAFSSCSEESKEKFQTQFDKKGRATLQVDVDVKDINGVITSQATFTWFIQAL